MQAKVDALRAKFASAEAMHANHRLSGDRVRQVLPERLLPLSHVLSARNINGAPPTLQKAPPRVLHMAQQPPRPLQTASQPPVPQIVPQTPAPPPVQQIVPQHSAPRPAAVRKKPKARPGWTERCPDQEFTSSEEDTDDEQMEEFDQENAENNPHSEPAATDADAEDSGESSRASPLTVPAVESVGLIEPSSSRGFGRRARNVSSTDVPFQNAPWNDWTVPNPNAWKADAGNDSFKSDEPVSTTKPKAKSNHVGSFNMLDLADFGLEELNDVMPSMRPSEGIARQLKEPEARAQLSDVHANNFGPVMGAMRLAPSSVPTPAYNMYDNPRDNEEFARRMNLLTQQANGPTNRPLHATTRFGTHQQKQQKALHSPVDDGYATGSNHGDGLTAFGVKSSDDFFATVAVVNGFQRIEISARPAI